MIVMRRNHQVLECAYCEVRVKKSTGNGKIGKTVATADHFIPISGGGENSFENLFVVCRKCNQEKGNMNPIVDREFWTVFLPQKLQITLC